MNKNRVSSLSEIVLKPYQIFKAFESKKVSTKKILMEANKIMLSVKG